jgi:hypothetical protein
MRYCPHCGGQVVPARKKRTLWWVVGGLMILALLGRPHEQASTPPLTDTPSMNSSLVKETLLQNVHLVNFSWSTGGFENIMMANFLIRNNNDFAIKDITVKCVHAGKSGTTIDSNTRTIYDSINAKSSKTFRDFNMGFIHSQAATSQCSLSSVVRVK